MSKAGLITESAFFDGFVQIIYHFHVPVFFFCSGFLFQHSFSCCSDKKEYSLKKGLRLLDLIIPYILFTLVNYVLKLIMADSVNTPVDASFFGILIHDPLMQMWYLYALAMVVLVTPVMRSEKSCRIIVGVSVMLKILSFFPAFRVFTGTTYILQQQIWYVLGAAWACKQLKATPVLTICSTTLFIALCTCEMANGVLTAPLDALATLSGVLACIGFFQLVTEKKTTLPVSWRILSRYMLQIYLLHTLFASALRIVLQKLGVSNLSLHMALGCLISFAGPIVCAWIAERLPLLNIVFFPTKTIRTLNSKR